jgi:hypothetical protein
LVVVLSGLMKRSHPVAGVDYPRTFQELDQWFRDDDACRADSRRLRWPGGLRLPGLRGERWALDDVGQLLRCRRCHGRTSLTAGTLFDGTRKPLRIWFMAMWFVTSQKNGVSALGLQRVLGLGSYETAPPRPAGRAPFRDRIEGPLAFDGRGCAGLKAAGYRHEISIMSATTDPAHEVMPRVHKVASPSKRCLVQAELVHRQPCGWKTLPDFRDEIRKTTVGRSAGNQPIDQRGNLVGVDRLIWESPFACLARTLLSAKVPTKPICAGVACRMVDAERAFSIVRYAPTGLT